MKKWVRISFLLFMICSRQAIMAQVILVENGKEDDDDPMNERNPNVGTIFGVYDFLENYLGVRWLWSGDLGTYVPRTNTIKISSVNRMEAPALRYRTMRGILSGGLLKAGNCPKKMHVLVFQTCFMQRAIGKGRNGIWTI